jgi:predicted DNA-binding protein
MISLRLSSDLDDKLNQIAKSEKSSKSEIVKRALVQYFDDYKKKHSPYELGSDLFGKYGSGDGTLSQNYKKILKEKLHEKHSR